MDRNRWARGLAAGVMTATAGLSASAQSTSAQSTSAQSTSAQSTSAQSTSPASATDKPGGQASTPVEGVVVTAPRRPALKDQAKATGQFILTHTGISPIGQVSRWNTPICPKTEGLPEGYNAFISNHVVLVAGSVGAPTRPVAETKPCDINVLIIFTPEPQKLLDEVAAKHPQLLGFHYYAQRKRLKTFNHPIESWYVTAARHYSGEETLDSPWDNIGQVVIQSTASRIQASSRSIFRLVLIVADSNKVADSKIGTIADFIAMLALAQPDRRSLESCEELASILDYMSPNCRPEDRPEALTAVDLAYLRALYHTSPEQSAATARGEIYSQMKRDLGIR